MPKYFGNQWFALTRTLTAIALGGFTLAVQAVSLSEFVTDVVNSNPLVREQVHAYRQVAQDYQIALGGWRPSLDLSSSLARSSRKASNTAQQRLNFNSSQIDLTLSQNLFNGFDTTNQVAQARARISSAAYRLYDTADNVALDAVRAYVNVLTEKRLVALAVQNLEAHQRIFSQIQERTAAGIGRRSDVEQTEGRLAQSHAGLIAQQNNLQDALTQLHKLVGYHLSPAEIVEPSSPSLPDGSLEELAQDAIATHPAIQSAIYNIEAARFDYQRAKSTSLPQLNLQLQQSVGENVGGDNGNLNESSVLFSLQYNLYRGGADQAEKSKRLSVMHESEAFLGRVRRQVIDALRLSWTAKRALQEQLPYLETHVVKSQETFDLYKQEFLLQKRDLIDVLDAENEWNRALARETEARYSALTARFRIYEGIGILFSPLDLDVDVSNDDLRIANITASGVDGPELPADRDLDGKPNLHDQCDNSTVGSVVDAYGCRQQSEIELGPLGVGQAPLAVEDTLETNQNQAVTVPLTLLLDNDSDPDGDTLTVSSYAQPVNGSLTRDADGNLIYAPDTDFTGEDQFNYTIVDPLGRTATGQVFMLVKRVRPDIPEVVIVQFDYKQLTLTDESQTRIDAIIAQLAGHLDVRVEASAYTDNVGSAQYNERLSGFRAQAMKQMLINRGLDEQRISAVGMGENGPIATNTTEEGRAQNRRGEFRFTFPAD